MENFEFNLDLNWDVVLDLGPDLELDNLFDYFTNIYISVGEGYGILEHDYDTIRHPWKLEQLQSLMPILSDHTEGL